MFSTSSIFVGISKIAPPKITHQKIVPYESSPCKKHPPEICLRENFPPWENHPPWNTLPTYKSYKFLAVKKAVQYNILIKITKVLFDIQMITQKTLGLDTFFTEGQNPKIKRKRKLPSGIYVPVVQVKEN